MKEIQWHEIGRANRNTLCAECNQKPKQYLAKTIEQTSIMRGDDEVKFYCIPCALKRGIYPDRAVAIRLIYMATLEEQLMLAERLK